jgi:hypothetical protein
MLSAQYFDGKIAGMNQLFSCNGLVLYCLLIVRSTAGRAKTVDVVFDVVVTELAHLNVGGVRLEKEALGRVVVTAQSYLVTARTRPKVPVGEVKLLDAERAVKYQQVRDVGFVCGRSFRAVQLRRGGGAK